MTPGLPRSGKRERPSLSTLGHLAREVVDSRNPATPETLASPKTCQHPAPGKIRAPVSTRKPRGRQGGPSARLLALRLARHSRLFSWAVQNRPLPPGGEPCRAKSPQA